MPVFRCDGDLTVRFAHVGRECESLFLLFLMSAAIGALSWSRILVLVFTEIPWVPSNKTRAVTTPPGWSFLLAPRDTTTRFGSLVLLVP